MRLSKNFTLDEFLLSQTAARQGIDMTPPPHVVDNLRRLVVTCLQPFRDEVDASILISSGYRPLELNTQIGGSKTSGHIEGNCADFTVVRMSPFDVAELIVALNLPFDQVIHEYGRWVHMSSSDNLRRQALTAHRVDGKVQYVHGISKMEDL